jgi:hypothetical protein
MRRRFCFAVWLFSVLLVAPGAEGCDSNGCLMLTRGSAGLLPRKSWQVDLSYRYSDVSARLQGSDAVGSVVRPKTWLERGLVVPGYHEDREGSESFVQLDVAYGLGADTTLFASAPLVSQRSYVVGHGGIESVYNVRGIGDLLVGVRRVIVRSPRRMLVATLGAELSTGRNDAIDDFDGTVMEPMLQPGSGATDGLLSLAWSTLAPGRSQLTLSGSWQAPGTNQYDYRFGRDAIAAATLSRSAGPFTPSLQVKWYDRQASELAGLAVPSTGSRIVYLNAGLRFRTPDNLGVYSFLTLPVYRRVEGAQLAPRLAVVVGLSRTF